MIYTSYYGNRRKYDGFYRISISRSAPEQSYDLRLLDLAPSSQLLQNYKNGITNEEEYTRRYLSSLETLKKRGYLDKFVNYLTNHTQDVVLLCYEKPDKFCHRHILANYLNQNYNMNIFEL